MTVDRIPKFAIQFVTKAEAIDSAVISESGIAAGQRVKRPSVMDQQCQSEGDQNGHQEKGKFRGERIHGGEFSIIGSVEKYEPIGEHLCLF